MLHDDLHDRQRCFVASRYDSGLSCEACRSTRGAHLRVVPGVVAERPADRLANEELAVGKVGLEAVVEQVMIAGIARSQLAQDCRAPAP